MVTLNAADDEEEWMSGNDSKDSVCSVSSPEKYHPTLS